MRATALGKKQFLRRVVCFYCAVSPTVTHSAYILYKCCVGFYSHPCHSKLFLLNAFQPPLF